MNKYYISFPNLRYAHIYFYKMEWYKSKFNVRVALYFTNNLVMDHIGDSEGYLISTKEFEYRVSLGNYIYYDSELI